MDWTSFSINLISILLAFAALVLSWREVRRSNAVFLRLEDFNHSYSARLGENNEQMFHAFSIRLRNTGISLHNLSVSLSFVGSDLRGRFRIPLKIESGETRHDGEFSRGMVAEFRLKSYELDPGSRAILLDLKNPAVQQARLDIYSQRFLANSFKVASRFDWMSSAWNRIAFRINRFCWTTKKAPDGTELVHARQPLPTFLILRQKVEQFAEAVRQGEPNYEARDATDPGPTGATWQRTAAS